MKFTHEQLEEIRSLKKEGQELKKKHDASKEVYKQACRQEVDAKQKVLDEHIFLIEDNIRELKKDTRITNPRIDFLMSEADFKEYLKYYQKALKDLFNLDIEYNCSHAGEKLGDYLKAEKEYLKIAPRFIRAMGRIEEATIIESRIDGYLKEEFKQKLIKYNNQFVGGF